MEDLTEEEVQVVGQALQMLLDKADEDQVCSWCASIDEDDDGELVHDASCDVLLARKLRARLGLENED